jgi:hypothetical protein
MSRRDSQEPVALLSPEEQQRQHDGDAKLEPLDIESGAGRAEVPKNQNIDHEYSIPSTVKFAWLGTYFFLSLLLTLYNKLVLTMVRDQQRCCANAFRPRSSQPGVAGLTQ